MFTVKQLEICDQRVTAGMSKRVSSTISRVKGTTWYAQRYQVTLVGEKRATKKAQLEAESINQTSSLMHVRKQHIFIRPLTTVYSVTLYICPLAVKNAHSFRDKNRTLLLNT